MKHEVKKAAIRLATAVLVLMAAGIAIAEESSSLPEEKANNTAENSPSLPKALAEAALNDQIQLHGGMTVVASSLSASDANDGIDGTMSVDLELTVSTSKSGKVHVLLEAGSGSGIDTKAPTLSGFNDDADDDHTVRPTEVWYEHTFGEKVRLRGGKVDLSTDFDTNEVANSETDQFLSTGFVNNLAVEFPDDNGLGMVLWIAPNDLLDLGFGFADADADWDNIFGTHFSMVELGFKPRVFARQGNYRVYGWHNGRDHERLTDAEITDDANYGFGISADQEIAEGVTLFARYGHQRGSVAPIEHAWSTGLQLEGVIGHRSHDTIGLAYGKAIIGEDWKTANPENLADFGNEHHLELYYSMRINRFLSLSPNLQWVKHPNGDKDHNSHWAGALRMQLSF